MSEWTPERTQEEIDRINQMSQLEMARMWRFTPSGHHFFDKTLPFFEVFDARFTALGGFTPSISKQLGW